MRQGLPTKTGGFMYSLQEPAFLFFFLGFEAVGSSKQESPNPMEPLKQLSKSNNTSSSSGFSITATKQKELELIAKIKTTKPKKLTLGKLLMRYLVLKPFDQCSITRCGLHVPNLEGM